MNKKIVIIGAGAAGIAAGTKLLENGFKNLLVLEAENRIGGRINSVSFGKNVVDMGAQWCHGEEDNVVCELAKKHKLLEANTLSYDTFLLIRSDGCEVPTEMSDKLMELAIMIVEAYKDEMKAYKGSLGNFIMEKYTAASNMDEYQSIPSSLRQEFIEFFHKYENSIEASDTWFDTSCAGYVDYWDCNGERLLNWKDKGYGTVFDLLMKKLPDSKNAIPIENKILFNKEVRCIKWKPIDEPHVTIECNDGSVYEADHVILTVSLGVLKERHLTMFNPGLPVSKTNAIEGLILGTVDKIYLEFATRFWPDGWNGFSMIWSKEDQEEIRKTGEDTWLEDIFGFYTVDYQPNVLCGWISGVNARRMERLAEDDVLKGSMFLIRKFLKGWNVPEPVAIIRSEWYSNPHFRGSYSFQSTKSDLLKTTAADLAAPLTNALGKPIVHFAGEATHSHYYSTVHGAVETGWREAKRIVDLYKQKPHL